MSEEEKKDQEADQDELNEEVDENKDAEDQDDSDEGIVDGEGDKDADLLKEGSEEDEDEQDEDKVEITKAELQELKMNTRLLAKANKERLNSLETEQGKLKQDENEVLIAQLKKELPNYEEEDLKALSTAVKTIVGKELKGTQGELQTKTLESSVINYCTKNRIDDKTSDVLYDVCLNDEKVNKQIRSGLVSVSEVYDYINIAKMKKENQELKLQLEGKKNQQAGAGKDSGGKKRNANKSSKKLSAEEIGKMDIKQYAQAEKDGLLD